MSQSQMLRPSLGNLVKNLPFVVSGGAFLYCWLMVKFGLLFVGLGVLLLLLISLFAGNIHEFWKANVNKQNVILTVVGAVFMFVYGQRVYLGLGAAIVLPPSTSRMIYSLVTSLLSTYFISVVLASIFSNSESKRCEELLNSPLYLRVIKYLIIFCAVFVLGCTLNPYVWADEAFTINLIKSSYIGIIEANMTDVHPPFYYMVTKFFVDTLTFFTDNYVVKIIVARLLSILFYVATILLCAKKLQSSSIKNVSSMLVLGVMGGVMSLYYALEIRMYGQGLFFVTASYLFAKDIMDNKEKMLTWVLLVACSLGAAYTHTYALVSAAFVWLYLFVWLLIKSREKIVRFIVSGLVVALLYLPWLIVLLGQVQMISGNYWIEPLTGYTIFTFVANIFPILFLFFMLLLITHVVENRNDLATIVYNHMGSLVLLSTMAVGVILSLASTPVFVIRYIAPGCLCLLLSVMLIFEKKTARAKTVLFLILVASALTQVTRQAAKEFRDYMDYREVVRMIDRFDDNSCLVFDLNNKHANHTVSVVRTYLDKPIFKIEMGEPLDLVDKLKTEYQQVYLLSADNLTKDIRNDLELMGTIKPENTINVYKLARE